MIIHTESEDIFEPNYHCIVNPVNTSGVMGAGLALQMRRKFPLTCTIFNMICMEAITKNSQLPGGHVSVYKNKDTPTGFPYIMQFATKKEVQYQSHISFIETGLRSLVDLTKEHGFKNIAIPALGVGYGGLKWTEVFPLIQDITWPLEETCDVHIYLPR